MYQDEKNEGGIIDDLEFISTNEDDDQDYQNKTDAGNNFQEEEKNDYSYDDEIVENEKKISQNSDQIILSKAKVLLIKKFLENIKESTEKLDNLLALTNTNNQENNNLNIEQNFSYNEIANNLKVSEDGNVVEGIFDGENMIGPDGKQYSVPANYASKSKLIEGDILKLTITSSGTFVYKQISPIDRIRIVGELDKDAKGNFIVRVDNKVWKVLKASVTYYKGDVGDEVFVIIPKRKESAWGAIDNIVKK